MELQLIRMVALLMLLAMFACDIKEIMEGMSNKNATGKAIVWKGPLSTSQSNPRIPRGVERNIDYEKSPYQTRGSRAREQTKQNSQNHNSDGDDRKINFSPQGTNTKPQPPSLTDHEKMELFAFKAQMQKIMQEWCLPKLICELHATAGERDSLTEAEEALILAIRESGQHPQGQVISRYHFAAHMGQLLANVDGNGCHNLYPNCPLSGNRVLQMVKKVKIKHF